MVPLFDDPTATVRSHAFAEHNWHDYQAFERSVFDSEYCYVRNWLPELPCTPPADAVKSATFRVMQELHQAGELRPEQQGCITASGTSEYLFRTTDDPHCVTNLATDPEYAEQLDRLRSRLQTWQQETADKFPGNDKLRPDQFDRTTGNRL